jgi:tetratricopeptide (TPR) repeat protein
MHEKLGDEGKALDFYRKALAQQPDQPQATEKFYGLVVAKASDMDRAEKLFDELVRLSPATSYVLNDYALLLRNWCESSGKHLDDSPPGDVKRRLKRSAEVYELAAKAAPDDPQIQSDTGLLFWYYPCTFDGNKAKSYLKRSLDLSDYSYLDAWNGLDKLCRKISDWETLAEYAERVVGAMERGVVPTSPVGGGAPEPRPNEKAGMQARADAALKLAQEKLKKS